jgi:hypothetical protein
MGHHEQFKDDGHPEGPTNRGFGLTVGGILLAITGFRFYFYGLDLPNEVLLGVGGLLVVFGAFDLAVLTIANKLWMALGRLLFRVVNPVVLLLMYVVCIVPVGLIMRVVGHDPLKRRFDAAGPSYWIEKKPGDIDEPMKHQF